MCLGLGLADTDADFAEQQGLTTLSRCERGARRQRQVRDCRMDETRRGGVSRDLSAAPYSHGARVVRQTQSDDGAECDKDAKADDEVIEACGCRLPGAAEDRSGTSVFCDGHDVMIWNAEQRRDGRRTVERLCLN